MGHVKLSGEMRLSINIKDLDLYRFVVGVDFDVAEVEQLESSLGGVIWVLVHVHDGLEDDADAFGHCGQVMCHTTRCVLRDDVAGQAFARCLISSCVVNITGEKNSATSLVLPYKFEKSVLILPAKVLFAE